MKSKAACSKFLLAPVILTLTLSVRKWCCHLQVQLGNIFTEFEVSVFRSSILDLGCMNGMERTDGLVVNAAAVQEKKNKDKVQYEVQRYSSSSSFSHFQCRHTMNSTRETMHIVSFNLNIVCLLCSLLLIG